jgi:hypothetical protein
MPLMPVRHTNRRLQYNADPVDHLQDTATMLGNPTGRSHATDHVRHGWTIRHDTLRIVEDIIC